MLSIGALFPVTLTLLTLLVLRCIQHRRDPASKPTLEAHWLWGHEYVVWQHEACAMYLKWATDLGPLYRIKASFFQRDVIVAADNLASHHILANAYRYHVLPAKAPAFLPLTDKLLGKGVVYAQGDEHKHQRRLIAPAFTLGAVKGMSDDVVECTQKFVERVANHVGSQGYETTMDIAPFVSACTLDIIGRIAFGHDFGCGESKEARDIAESWHKDVLLGRTMAGFLAPIMMCAFPWITELPIPALQTDGVAKRVAINLAGELLRQNKAQLESGDGKDILSILVKDQKKSKHDERLSQTTLLENVSLEMVGHETTSCTVSFTLLELARHPAVQQKLRQEIRDLSDFSYDHIQSLPYLDAVCREGLRVHPAAPRTDRIALEDDVIPLSQPLTTVDGKTVSSIAIKAGQVFHIPNAVQNIDPFVWGKDAEEFKPERWLLSGGVPSADQLPHGPYGNIASFLDGPRSCIGWRLALLEFKIMISLLIRDFELISTPDDVKGYISGTLQAFVGEEVKMPIHVKMLRSSE
ncbi:cytochrome P450 [Armillaria gallica]|uniref:Cytochrome P450 n=1 Tax=Armillaria gallica TaxID=47427 RepID=A0A2H3CGZ1_ARMGA|nr:cytochrome P450 [Armillaria gallica]